MTARFAARTRVPVEKTKAEIERLVKRYGAKGFASGWQGDAARIEFVAHNRHIRFTVMVPQAEQAARQKWRALLLLVKAKLEAVDAKIATFEEAFVGDIVMPDGKTVWEAAREPIKLAYDTGKPVALLGGACERMTDNEKAASLPEKGDGLRNELRRLDSEITAPLCGTSSSARHAESAP